MGGHLSRDAGWDLMGTGCELINNAPWYMCEELIVLNEKEDGCLGSSGGGDGPWLNKVGATPLSPR